MKNYLQKRWHPLILWALIIILASSNPNHLFGLDMMIPSIRFFEAPLGILLAALIHIIAYQILCFLLARSLTWNKDVGTFYLALAFMVTLVFALAIEGSQSLFNRQSFSFFNPLMAGWGALLGILAHVIWHSPWFNDNNKNIPPKQDLLL